jgi:hypothetical protein
MHLVMLAYTALGADPCPPTGARVAEIQSLLGEMEHAAAAPIVDAALAELACQDTVVEHIEIQALFLAAALVAEKAGLGASVRDQRVTEAVRVSGALPCDNDDWSIAVCDAFDRVKKLGASDGALEMNVDAWVDGVWVARGSAARRPLGRHLIQHYDAEGALITSWGEVRADTVLQVGAPIAQERSKGNTAARVTVVSLGGAVVAGGLASMAVAMVPARASGISYADREFRAEKADVKQANTATAVGAGLIGAGTLMVGFGASF